MSAYFMTKESGRAKVIGIHIRGLHVKLLLVVISEDSIVRMIGNEERKIN